MKRKLPYLIIILLFLFGLISFTSISNASDLTTTLVRLNRLSANTTTGGMICAKPTSNSTEAFVSITFPNGFIVNNNSSNWTVTTINLLTGASAWPGIGTATGVSGQTVTFPSSDLATGTTYCFNFSGASTLTTSPTGEKSGSVTTRNSGGTPIDSGDYGVTIVANDSINVSATVAANPTDFDADLALTNPTGSVFPENTTLSYTLTYGSSLSYGSNIDVEADWTLGTIAGSGTPTVDILDYVIGSASDGYGGATPIVDTINRKITWHITSFPGNTTGQTVTFQLKTNQAYTGPNTVSFSVNGRVVGPGTQTPDSTVTSDYQFSGGPTPTPTSGPTSTPGPGPTATPGGPTSTPTPGGNQGNFSFNSINIESISAREALVSIGVNETSTIALSYGIDPTDMSKTVNINQANTNFLVNLSKLNPETTYYFIVKATDQAGQTISSDIYTFTTAKISELPEVNLSSLITSSNNNIISSGGNASGSATIPPTIVMPINAPYEFRFSLSKNIPVKRIRAILRPKNVLGVNTISENTTNLSTDNVEIIELTPGVYIGRLLGEPKPGDYELYVQIADYNGNIAEQRIANIKFILPLTVFSLGTKRPIEGAKVTLYVYNTYSRIYSLISPSVLNIQNPIYTDRNGVVRISLPQGSYKARIESINYEPQEINFSINPSAKSYPQVYLIPQAFSIFNIIRYYASIISDLYTATKLYVEALAQSFRFFDLVASLSLLLLVITAISSFSVRTKIKATSIPSYILFEIEELFFKHSHQKYIYGEVMDHTSGKHIGGATILIYEQHSPALIAKTTTNKAGDFFVKRPSNISKIRITIEKNGYNSFTAEYTNVALTTKLQATIGKKNEIQNYTILEMVAAGIENIIGFSFELLLLLSLFFELIFIQTIGLITTLPFILISTFTIIVWLFYAHRVLRKRLSASY